MISGYVSYNRSTNWRTEFSPFFIVYENNLRASLDLAHVPDLKRVSTKVEDFIAQIQEVHKAVV